MNHPRGSALSLGDIPSNRKPTGFTPRDFQERSKSHDRCMKFAFLRLRGDSIRQYKQHRICNQDGAPGQEQTKEDP